MTIRPRPSPPHPTDQSKGGCERLRILDHDLTDNEGRFIFSARRRVRSARTDGTILTSDCREPPRLQPSLLRRPVLPRVTIADDRFRQLRSHAISVDDGGHEAAGIVMTRTFGASGWARAEEAAISRPAARASDFKESSLSTRTTPRTSRAGRPTSKPAAARSGLKTTFTRFIATKVRNLGWPAREGDRSPPRRPFRSARFPARRTRADRDWRARPRRARRNSRLVQGRYHAITVPQRRAARPDRSILATPSFPLWPIVVAVSPLCSEHQC